VAALLAAGADPDMRRSTDGATPLYVACQRAHLPVVRCLLEAGADPNLRRSGGFTPLWTACDRGHSSIVEMLVSTVVAREGARQRARPGATSSPCADFGLPCDEGIRPANAAKRAGHRHLGRLVELTARHQADAKRQGQLGAKPRPPPLPPPGSPPRAVRGSRPPPKAASSDGAGDAPGVGAALATARVGVWWAGRAREVGAKQVSPDCGGDLVPARDALGDATSGAQQGKRTALAAAGGVSAGSALEREEEEGDIDVRGKRPEDTLYVYSTARSWAWEHYIRQSAMHTHDVCKCVRRSPGGDGGAATKPGGALPPCRWWRLQPDTTDLESCQVSVSLFKQIEVLHQVVGGAHLPKGLRFTQCLFTESRGGDEARRHTLELRLTHARPKRLKEAAGLTSPCLVRRDEVVLLLGLPLRFPLDGRVRLHCMQGRPRLPPAVLGPAAVSPSACPGDLLPLAWLTPEVWPARYSLADFARDLMERIAREDRGDGLGGLLPVPPYRLNAAAADELLLANEAAAAKTEAARVAKHNAPLKPDELRARRLAVLAFAVNFLLFGLLLYLKKYNI